MNRKARLFQIANFTNFFSIVIFFIVVIYRTTYNLNYNSGDTVAFGVLLFVLLVYLVNFYFGLKITSAYYKEVVDFKLKSATRTVFIVFEIIVLIAYTVLLAFLIPRMNFRSYNEFTFDNFIRIVALLCLLIVYPSSIIRLILTRPLIKAIALKNKHIFDDLGTDTQ